MHFQCVFYHSCRIHEGFDEGPVIASFQPDQLVIWLGDNDRGFYQSALECAKDLMGLAREMRKYLRQSEPIHLLGQ